MKTTRPIIETRKSTKGSRKEIRRTNRNQGGKHIGTVVKRSSCSWYICLQKSATIQYKAIRFFKQMGDKDPCK
jgi:hypothetical protein